MNINTNNTVESPMRAAFEQSYFDRNDEIERKGDGYSLVGAQIAWMAWQGAYAAGAAREQQLVNALQAAQAAMAVAAPAKASDWKTYQNGEQAIAAALVGSTPAKPAFSLADVRDAYDTLRATNRTKNSSIPDDALDSMRDTLYAAVGRPA